MNETKDLEIILSQVLNDMKEELGEAFLLEKVNLAEIERRTGISRARLRNWKNNGFHILPHGNTLQRGLRDSIVDPYVEYIKEQLNLGVDNKALIFERIVAQGYRGSLTTLKEYLYKHPELKVPQRLIAQPKQAVCRRYTTEPGECYQMDWGFVNVVDLQGNIWKAACFAMVCHHCGQRYIEFFPNAKQENLFIGILHAFMLMGIPKRVLTDNMKSVVIKRDEYNCPIWNKDYDEFQKLVGFTTNLCKVAHPFTKGAVERLVKFVKTNFVLGRTFINVTDLNEQALKWCNDKNKIFHKGLGVIPSQVHFSEPLIKFPENYTKFIPFLAPLRKISNDGFINYEGRLYGVPYSYQKNAARVLRTKDTLEIIDMDTYEELTEYYVDWSKTPHICDNQWSIPEQPEEFPTMPVVVSMKMKADSQPNFDIFKTFEF